MEKENCNSKKKRFDSDFLSQKYMFIAYKKIFN